MPRYVAFLGSINVGGHRVTMDRLKAETEALGFTDVSTFIASGNVILRSRARAGSVEQSLAQGLEAALGFPVPAYVRTDAEVADIAATEPFGELPDGWTHMVGLLAHTPDAEQAAAVAALGGELDTLEVHGRELHWRIAGRSTASLVKPRAIAKAIGGPMTTRNRTMLRRLAAQL